MKKKILLLFFSLLSFNAIHAEITWTLSADGTLTISGTDMPNGQPWGAQARNIKKVVINDGVTNIGDYAFLECRNLTSISIPNSVTSIGEFAFYLCQELTSITIPESLTSIGSGAFMGCI